MFSLNGLDDRVPDLGLYTQHGAFLAAYEPTGDQIGPTLEVYGAYKESQDSTLYVFQVRSALPHSFSLSLENLLFFETREVPVDAAK